MVAVTIIEKRDSVSLLAIYLLIVFLLLTAAGFRTYFTSRKDELNRVFFYLALCWGLWHLNAFGRAASDTAATVAGWSILGIPRFAAIPLLLHAVLLLTGRLSGGGGKTAVVLGLYLPVAAIAALQIGGILIGIEPVRSNGVWVFERKNILVTGISIGWVAALALLSIIAAAMHFRTAAAPVRRDAGRIAAVLIPIAVISGVTFIVELFIGSVSGTLLFCGAVAGAGCTFFIYRYNSAPENQVTVAEDILAAIPDALLITTIDGTIRRINPKAEEMTGYTSVESVRLNIDQLFETGFGAAIYKKAASSANNRWTQEARLRTKSGSDMPVVVNLALICKTRKRVPAAMVFSCHDSSFEKMALDEFGKTEQLEALGFLAGGIAHDFNNLLTSIIAYLSLARTTEELSDSLRQKLDKVDSAAQMVINLNRQLAAISKRVQPNKEVCSVREIIESAIQLSLSGSSIACHTNIPADLHSIAADATQLNQVFLNLLVNARQAMDKGGIIGVRCVNRTIDGTPWIEVEIADQGCGIPSDTLDEVFKAFYTTKPHGTGLGLAVVKSVVEKHGGTIEVSSRRNVGTTFTVRLPSEDSTAAERREPHDRADDRPVAPGKILVMDDEEGVRRAITMMLTEKEHTVCAVEHGAAAIAAYLKHQSDGVPFDLLILDVTVRNGYGAQEVIKRLREINPAVSAIVMSGYTDSSMMKDYHAYGFADVIAKPFDSRQIYHVVNKTLSRMRKTAA